MICVKGNILFYCSLGDDFTHQVGRHKPIKEQKCFLQRCSHLSSVKILISTTGRLLHYVITALGLTLNQNSSVNIHDRMSKHKVLITPTWGWPLSICKSFKWKNFPRRGIRTCTMFWLTDRMILFGEALSPLCLSLSPSTTSPLSQSALHYLHVYD